MTKDRDSRRQDVLARARTQRLAQEDLEQAQNLERTATAVAAKIRAALALQPGSNLEQLEYIRLALGYEADASSHTYHELVTVALNTGLVTLLAPNLSLALRSRAAVGALKASHIICNIAANLPDAVAEIIKVSPLLVAHLGLGYGPALCLQCAWALGNMAAASQAAAGTLVAQGAIPALLHVVSDAARASDDTATASAGATCAWALGNIVRGIGGPRAANVLLSATDPRPEVALSRAFGSTHAAPDLVAEAAWLFVHMLRWAAPGSQQLACREFISHSVCVALEAAVASTSEAAAACLSASSARWAAAPPVQTPSPKHNVPAAPAADADAVMPMDTAQQAHACRVPGCTAPPHRETTGGPLHNGTEEAALPLLLLVGALTPQMTPRQLQSAVAAHAGAAPRALLAAAQHCSGGAAVAALWALANLASTPLATRVLTDLGAADVARSLLGTSAEPELHCEAATLICNLAACVGRDLGREDAGGWGGLAPLRSALRDTTFLRVAADMLQPGRPAAPKADVYSAAASNLVMLLHWELPEVLTALEQMAGPAAVQEVVGRWQAQQLDADESMADVG